MAPLDHWTWLRRLEEEVTAGAGAFAVLVGRSGAFASDRLVEALSESSSIAGDEARRWTMRAEYVGVPGSRQSA